MQHLGICALSSTVKRIVNRFSLSTLVVRAFISLFYVEYTEPHPEIEENG